MWLFYYTTKFHFLSSAEIKLGLEDTVYKGCSDKPDPRRLGVKPSTLGGQSERGTLAPELEQLVTEQDIGLLIPVWSIPSKKNTPLGHRVNQRTPNFNSCLVRPFSFSHTNTRLKKYPSPSSGYNTLQQVSAFLQLQRVSLLTSPFPSGFPSTASLSFTQHRFSQKKGALFAISLPPPPPQLQRSPNSLAASATPIPSQPQQPKPTGGQKGIRPLPGRVNECPLRRGRREGWPGARLGRLSRGAQRVRAALKGAFVGGSAPAQWRHAWLQGLSHRFTAPGSVTRTVLLHCSKGVLPATGKQRWTDHPLAELSQHMSLKSQ